ncbi:MAG TPA: serine/threonine-protein kinase, partial [Candidatus Thermoplasmatota archaeon]|nr:serine/threonine-protein kinase [Candidatus Thermoplasmatota archaeon]
VVLGAAGGLLALLLAAVVLRAAPRRGMNRTLAGLLLAEGLVHALVLTRLGLPPTAAKALAAVHFACVLALPFLYLLVLGTLGTPWVRLLRRRDAQAFLVAYPVLAAAVGAPLVWAAAVPGSGGPPGALAVFYRASVLLVGAVSLFGLAAALAEVRRTLPGTAPRARAVSYATAFGARDVFFALLVVDLLFLRLEPALWPSLATFAFVPLLAYGFLRTQLFDIDLRIRWTIERGTLALVFVGLYLVVSQAAQATVSARYGPALGIAAAALLVLALVPLRRLARRVAAALTPGADADAAALSHRKLEIYRDALEQALDGSATLGPKERAILASLREKLGLTEREAAVLEYAAGATRAGAPADGALSPGELVLGKYRILRALGEGGHARTYLAEQERVGRRVVVKALRASVEDAEAPLREARATAAVRHPNVVTLHDVEQAGGRILLVMEHVEGGSLKDRLAGGPLAPAEFRRVASELLSALDAVHRAGALHRDVKPANVLLTREGAVKLADFGVAQAPGLDATLGLGAQPAQGGTPRYMSPEQAKGKRLTASSDLYSAAATLYEAYAGRPFLEGGESAAELQARAAAAGPFARPLDAPPALRAWFARALDPDPARRFASAGEMRDALAAAVAASA